MGQYEKSLTNRTARPRSERLREIGGLIVPASAAAAGGYGIGGLDHVHWNLSDLNKLSVQGDYLYLSRDVVDPDSGDISRELVKVSAGYADRALSNADGNELNWFIPETVDGVLTLKLNPVYAGLWAEGWIADGGIGTGGGGGGGGTYVAWGTKVGNTRPLTVEGVTETLLLEGALAEYALQSWVLGLGFVLPTDLVTINHNSLVGSGDITIQDGTDGKSAYQIWLDEGNVGTEADFLASLKGDPGSSQAYPFSLYNGLDSSSTTEALTALQGKLLLARIVSLGRRVRPKTPTDHYPFVTDNATTEEFGHAIAEIYINGDIHTSNDIRLRTLRYRQTSGSWSGERTEFVIADANGPLLQSLSYETPPSVQFFHTDDYSVCVIVNWCALTADTGYGADYASSSDKTLADGVFDLRNSPIIGLLIASGKLEYDVDESGIAGSVSPTWLQYGIDSAGGINEYSDQAHTTIEGVTPGTTFVFQKPIYRVNLFLDGEFIGQDSDFLPGIGGETEYHSPGDTLYDSIMVSMIGDYTEPNDVEFILNVPTALSILKDAIGTKQDYIKGNVDSVVDYSSYVQNGSIDGTTGLLVPYTWYRSLVGLPLPADKNVVILNPADTASNKRISFWDSSDNLTRVISVQDMTNYKLEHTASEVKANVTLLSGMSPYPERMSEIQVFTTLDDKVKIDNINGIPIDVPSVPEGVLTGIKAAGTMLPKDGDTVDIPNASSTQSGLLSPADKAKLDIITPGDITISGSGVTKNASAFGFLPTKTASENVAALQAAVDGGGTILVDFPGTYLVNDTVILESDTTLIFGAGVYVSLQADKRFLLNEGAENRTYDENISVVGLNLISNGRNVTSTIYGLRGYIAFFYIRNLYISHFQLLDGGSNPFVIHVCTFENVMIENIRVEGNKDAVHFGRGTKFVVRHGLFKTYDDPIAVNAHDYPTSNPEYGDIVDGLVEDCYDLADSSTVGYFARLLPGAWVDWSSGMSVHGFGDTVVSEGRIYATTGTMGTTQTSTVKPTFASGTQTLSDGVTWTMMQDTGVTHSATCKNIHFRNIHLQKDRPTAIQALLDNSSYSRSYYPGAVVPVIRNLTLENIFVEAEITNILNGSAPIDIVKVINSDTTKLVFSYTSETGLTYPRTDVVMMGCTFRGTGSVAVITGSSSRSVYAKILGSIVESGLTPSVSNVTLISNDIGIS